MSDQTAQQQIVDRLKDVDTVLVTVSRDPSVDELSAALGFTLLVNQLGKHGTAVFSGTIPPAITFLDPQKTFENTVDSLRDFIIALDKEKADHLRYKVDGDMVKIFITPYRTTITQKDLDFSQGDYNVEMVVAIGVKNDDDLDRALADHGRILHDATVASLSLGDNNSELGTINWHGRDVSSYSEMLVEVAEKLRSDKTLIDEQIATAFLTGIVAATERFSNIHTTPNSMTVAAQLMAAGANQQLIATKLAEGGQSVSTDEPKTPSKKQNNDGTTPLDDDELTKVEHDSSDDESDEPVKDKQAVDGTMAVSHEPEGNLDEVAEQVHAKHQQQAVEEAAEQLDSLNHSPDTVQPSSAEDELSATLAGQATDQLAKPSVADLQRDLQAASESLESAASEPGPVLPAPVASTPAQSEPSLGGTLNATTDQAAEDSRRAAEDERNKTILSHNSSEYISTPPPELPLLNSFTQPKERLGEPPSVDPFGGSGITPHGKTVQPSLVAADDVSTPPAAVQPVVLPPLDASSSTDTTTIDPIAAAPTAQPTADSGLPPLPPLPPMPDFSTLPPLPSTDAALTIPTTPPQADGLAAPALEIPQPPVSGNSDPSQFKIPGQP